MPTGPGKYDPECKRVLNDTLADAVLLIVIRGAKGTGFGANFVDTSLVAQVPAMLRRMADEIERST